MRRRLTIVAIESDEDSFPGYTVTEINTLVREVVEDRMAHLHARVFEISSDLLSDRRTA